MVRILFYLTLAGFLVFCSWTSINKIIEQIHWQEHYKEILNEVGLDLDGNVIDQEKFIQAIKESQSGVIR